MRHLPEIPIYGYVGGRQIHALWASSIKTVGVTVSFQLKFVILHANCGRHRFPSIKIVGVTGYRGLWALEWAWHSGLWALEWAWPIAETNMRRNLRNLHA